jgi:Skp family chaperone for outer membrane proteins
MLSMKKYFLIFGVLLLLANSSIAQSGKSVRIGYIDMEYILQNVPEYTEANNQLELKAQKWKQQLEVKKNEITRLKDALKTERVLLTKELIEEREDAIVFVESEMSDIQQKRFGTDGDFVIHKEMLVKPIQDQIFNAVQDIADNKRYDFIFDKASDLTMLFANKRFNISDQVIRLIARAGKAEQRTKKQIKADEAKEMLEDIEAENPELAAKKKAQETRKSELIAKQEARKVLKEKGKAEAETRRLQNVADREAKKNGTIAKKIEVQGQAASSTNGIEVKSAAQQIIEAKIAERKAAQEVKQKDLEDRKRAIEDRKAKTIADREAAKKSKEEQKKNVTPNNK